MRTLEDFIMPTQEELFDELSKIYAKDERTLICRKNYILVEGEAPIMLVAHLDTVHKEPVRYICKAHKGNILMSPQGIGGDDRCGVYALFKVYENSNVKPWLLFTCDEEIGGVGASMFCKHHEMKIFPSNLDEIKAIIEIDRKGENDAVYYDCENEEFEDYITKKGFVTNVGSFSDISYVAPELGVAAVNLSSGYYNAHTLHEYIDRRQLNDTIVKVIEIVADSVKSDFPKYEYIEKDYNTGYGQFRGYDWDYYDYFAEEIPKDIPDDVRGEYIELLDFYSITELEAIRAENGNRAIHLLYESEVGTNWESICGCDIYDEEM